MQRNESDELFSMLLAFECLNSGRHTSVSSQHGGSPVDQEHQQSFIQILNKHSKTVRIG